MSKKESPSWHSLYPFESHFFDLDGLRYHYIDERKPGSADTSAQDCETLLMVHGNPTWSFFFRNLVTALRDRYRVIAVDHIGCGLSDKPTESDYPFTLERRIQDLCRFMEQIDLQKVTLVAHDWGGAIGMGAATRLPKRFDRFILMNTSAFPGFACPLRIRLCHIPGFGRFAVQGLNVFAQGATWMTTGRRTGIPKLVRRGLVAPYDNWVNRTAIYQFVQDIPLTPKHPTYGTLKAIEAKLPLLADKSVCLIWGMRDWCFTPEYLKRFIQFFPTAQVHRLENAHHYLLEDAPDEVLDAMNHFLGG